MVQRSSLYWAACRSPGSSLVSRHARSHCLGMGKQVPLQYSFMDPLVIVESEKSVSGDRQILLMWHHVGRKIAQ